MKRLHPVSYLYLKPLGFGHHLQIKKPWENVRYQSRSAVWHAHIGDLLHASSCKSKKKWIMKWEKPFRGLLLDMQDFYVENGKPSHFVLQVPISTKRRFHGCHISILTHCMQAYCCPYSTLIATVDYVSSLFLQCRSVHVTANG